MQQKQIEGEGVHHVNYVNVSPLAQQLFDIEGVEIYSSLHTLSPLAR